uniref:THAP-type domain-containing protein n=1 Tax=Gouania willdenowi TaxID=441366 RepID=A0A8C5ECS6_GOUWI
HTRGRDENLSRGITFHNDTGLRRQWEVVLRWEGCDSSKLCSEHFKPDDFDRMGQIVRLIDGETPSVFTFPSCVCVRECARAYVRKMNSNKQSNLFLY